MDNWHSERRNVTPSVGLHTAADVWSALKNSFNRATMEREFTLQHQLETLRRENCESHNDCLSKYKSLCDELAAIEKSLSEDGKSFWMINGLCSNYQMFTTMTSRPPLPSYNELLSMLQSYESRIILQESSSSADPHVAFAANKVAKQKQIVQPFSSEKRGFASTIATLHGDFGNLNKHVLELENKVIQKNIGAKTISQTIRTEEELQITLRTFKHVCQLCNKPGHNVFKCFKCFNKDFKYSPIQKKNEVRNL